jgi:ABC-type uncharacterized transport system ATPase subunit
VPVRVTHGLGAVTCADLRQHVVDVAFHRRLTDHEAFGPVAVNAIVVEDLVKRYGRFTAVEDVSFTAAPGEVTALLGPNGAGKTTTIEILEGFQAPTAGTIRVLGTDPRAGSGGPGSGWSCSRPAWTPSSP